MNRPENCPSVTVLICTLNEEQNLTHVLTKIPRWVDEIILVDGHSTDRTVKVAKELRPEIKILYQPNKGKGDAIIYGVKHASNDIIVSLDADGATPPEEIVRFVEPLLNGYHFAKGSRLARGRPRTMSLYRWFGNKFLVLACNILYGTRFTDICSGYYSFWKDKFLQLELTYNLKEAGCSMEQQMIVRAKKADMKIKEVPHSSYGRISGASVISGFKRATKQGFADLSVIIRERFRDK